MKKKVRNAFTEARCALTYLAYDRHVRISLVLATWFLCTNGAYAQSSEPSIFEMIGSFNWWMQVMCYVICVVLFIKAGFDWSNSHMVQCGLSVGGGIFMLLAPHMAKSMFVSAGVLQDGDKVLPQRPSSVK